MPCGCFTCRLHYLFWQKKSIFKSYWRPQYNYHNSWLGQFYLLVFHKSLTKMYDRHSPLHLHLRMWTLDTCNPACEAAHSGKINHLCETIFHYQTTVFGQDEIDYEEIINISVNVPVLLKLSTRMMSRNVTPMILDMMAVCSSNTVFHCSKNSIIYQPATTEGC